MTALRAGVDITVSGSFRLSLSQRLSYSVGHVLNDLCASLWFTYLLLYLRQVAHLSNSTSGYLMLWGQVVDAVSTPFVGYVCDRMNGMCGYGKRKSFHALGTFCVLVSFPFMFSRGLGSAHGEHIQVLYYASFIGLFQFGWAATQVSHLALIPELTTNDSERVELNAFRNSFTVLSSVLVYTVAWLLFSLGQDGSEFFTLMLISVIAGTFFSLIFHIGVSESRASSHTSLHPGESLRVVDWLKEHQFYLIAAMYMCSRLIANVSQTYWPLYLTESLKLAKHFMAVVPLVVFASGFFTSLIMRPLVTVFGRKKVCLFGFITTIIASIGMWFISSDNALCVLLPALLLGTGGSILLVTSLSMTADLIGTYTGSGAFVFGAMSFSDKLSSGVSIVLIQLYHPCKSVECCADCKWYYRNIMILLPTVVSVISVLILLILAPMKLGRLRWHPPTPHTPHPTRR